MWQSLLRKPHRFAEYPNLYISLKNVRFLSFELHVTCLVKYWVLSTSIASQLFVI